MFRKFACLGSVFFALPLVLPLLLGVPTSVVAAEEPTTTGSCTSASLTGLSTLDVQLILDPEDIVGDLQSLGVINAPGATDFNVTPGFDPSDAVGFTGTVHFTGSWPEGSAVFEFMYAIHRGEEWLNYPFSVVCGSAATASITATCLTTVDLTTVDSIPIEVNHVANPSIADLQYVSLDPPMTSFPDPPFPISPVGSWSGVIDVPGPFSTSGMDITVKVRFVENGEPGGVTISATTFCGVASTPTPVPTETPVPTDVPAETPTQEPGETPEPSSTTPPDQLGGVEVHVVTSDGSDFPDSASICLDTTICMARDGSDVSADAVSGTTVNFADVTAGNHTITVANAAPYGDASAAVDVVAGDITQVTITLMAAQPAPTEPDASPVAPTATAPAPSAPTAAPVVRLPSTGSGTESIGGAQLLVVLGAAFAAVSATSLVARRKQAR